ncbi:MAG: class I SAM-dependent methyltransferase [Candidatus Omnitrophota bacterium]|nr:class I SAM-dependent methyltransferase [Candidatus Omnitrophota bacterium]
MKKISIVVLIVFILNNAAYGAGVGWSSLRPPLLLSGKAGEGPNEKAVRDLYGYFYGTREIPDDILRKIILPAVESGDLNIVYLKKALEALKESKALKWRMSEAFANAIVNFLILVNPDRHNPLVMTSRNRYPLMLSCFESEEFKVRYPIFKNSGEGLTLVEGGIGHPSYSTEELMQNAWKGDVKAIDKDVPNTLLMFKGKDYESQQEVVLHVLLDRSVSGEFSFKKITVDCSDERVRVALEAELMRDNHKLEETFLNIARDNYNNRIPGIDLEDLSNALVELPDNLEFSGIKEYFNIESWGIVNEPYDVLKKKYPNRIDVVRGDVFNLADILHDKKVDVIRIMNVLSYFSVEKREDFLRQANEVLNEGGVLIEGLASPNGGEFIYLIHKKTNGKLVKSETVISPTNLTRPLWVIFDENDPCIAEQTKLSKAIYDKKGRLDRDAEQDFISRNPKEAKKQLDKMVKKKIAELRQKVEAKNPRAGEKEKNRLLRVEIFNYLQSVPYQSISRELDPVYGPLQILEGWGGMCNAKTFLAGLLFKEAGYDVEYHYAQFDWSKQSEKIKNTKFYENHKSEYDKLVLFAERLKDVPYMHQFLKVEINDKWVAFDATWDKPVAEALGFNTEWDDKSNMQIAVNGMRGKGGKEMMSSNPTGYTPEEAADIINETYRMYNSNSDKGYPFFEYSRLFLRQLSDIFWWIRAPEMIKDVSLKGARVKINSVGAISIIYDLPDTSGIVSSVRLLRRGI